MNYFDIGANLLDPMFDGRYQGKKIHQKDLDVVLKRAIKSSVQYLITTSTSLETVAASISLTRKYITPRIFTTIGIHPTEAKTFHEKSKEKALHLLSQYKKEIISIGECGLDYDRLSFANKEEQQSCFEMHFDLAERTQLPMFLHLRNAFDDFITMLKENRQKIRKAVIHSFTGTLEEAEEILSFENTYIGLNGCSLKTKENLEVVKELPIERVLLETDAPWCSIRPSHACYSLLNQTDFREEKKKERYLSTALVKGRNEPCCIENVMKVFSTLKKREEKEVTKIIFKTTKRFFGIKE